MHGTKLTACMAALVAATTLSACAPDAWQNTKATGFNDYLKTVEAQCQPLWIGQMNLRSFDASSAGGQVGNFDMLLDSTSRLYYNRITPAAFRNSVQAMVTTSTDARTNQSIDCMIAKLPPERPRSPPGAVPY
ncbi:MAG TPA: hypothetical protein VLN25_00055 [Burkholderiaceae bacterium]|nr:hypothetical protein [Burkholderiaceae bacterium]